MKFRNTCAALLLSCVFSPMAMADYANITIDGNFADWTGVSQITDPTGETGLVDFTSLQVANNENFVFYRFDVDADITDGTYFNIGFSVDEDLDASTGFDVFGLGQVGAETTFLANLEIDQTDGNFNSGVTLGSSGSVNSSLLINGSTGRASVEVSIARTAFHTGGNTVFGADGTSVGLMLWTDADFDAIHLPSYTMMAPSAVPEPGSLALIATGMLGLVARRRRS